MELVREVADAWSVDDVKVTVVWEFELKCHVDRGFLFCVCRRLTPGPVLGTQQAHVASCSPFEGDVLLTHRSSVISLLYFAALVSGLMSTAWLWKLFCNMTMFSGQFYMLI